MTQLSLIDEYKNQFSDFYTIKYDGNSDDLQSHEINARLYANSIGGYVKFIQSISHELIGKNVEIYILKNDNGSFKTIIKIVGNSFLYISAAAGLLSWLGIQPNDISNYIIEIQKKIVQYVIDSKGITDEMIKLIYIDASAPEEVKNILYNIVRNSRTRKNLDDFTSPLDRKGYNTITVLNNHNKSFSINDEQRKAFKFIPPDIIEDDFFKENVRILYLSPELTEWKFQGTKEFWAEVTDEHFLSRTKLKRFSELSGRYYVVSGTRRTIKKYGAKKGITTWIIDKVSDMQVSYSLFDT